MGTTISALLVLGEYAVTAQVGDSRIYQVRDGDVEQITEDHTLIAWQLKQGLITPEEARSSPHSNVITRAVGNRDYVAGRHAARQLVARRPVPALLGRPARLPARQTKSPRS